MPAYSSAQRQAIAKFVNFTDAKDSVAAKSLKAHNWNVEAAVDAYFANPQDNAPSGTTSNLNKIFDSYRDAPNDNPDGIGIEGAMKYLGDIKVQLDEVVCLAIAELLKCPSMGEFTRENFVDGWKSLGCDTIQKQTAHAANLRSRIPVEPDLFRRVYRYTFGICRIANQRNLTLEIAAEQWRLFFTASNGGVSWNTPNTPWLDWWIEFMESSFKRPVNKDLWEQTEVLMRKTREDESMSWWSPDGAWPGAIDDFVEFVKEKRKGNGTEAMEVE